MRFYRHKTDGSSVFALVLPGMSYARMGEHSEVCQKYLAECKEVDKEDVPHRLLKALRLKGYTI